MSKITNDSKKDLKPTFSGSSTMTIDGTDFHIDSYNGRNHVMSNVTIPCPYCFYAHTEREFWSNPNSKQDMSDEGFYCLKCEKYFEVSTLVEKILYISEEVKSND